MALTVADVLAVIAPSYAADPRVPTAAQMATQVLVGYLACLTGDALATAQARLVAHYLTLGDRQAAAAAGGDAGGVVVGGVTSQSAGGVSQSYGAIGSGGGGYYADDTYRTTPHGLAWLAQRDALPCARRVGWAR